jgi:hypothetical protein
MFAVAVLRKVVEFQNDKTLSVETLNERIAEYVVDSALDLNLLSADGWTGVFSLNDLDLDSDIILSDAEAEAALALH